MLQELTAVAQRLLGSAGTAVSLVVADALELRASSPEVASGVGGGCSDGPSLSGRTVFCHQVVVSGAPVLVADVEQMGAQLPATGTGQSNLDVRAYCGVPLSDERGRVLGVLCAVEPTPRVWTDDDVLALQQLAVLASAEVAARQAGSRSALSWQRAEAATGQAELLLALSDALNSTETVVDVAAAVDDAAAAVLGVRWSYVGVVDAPLHAVRFVPIPGRPGDEDSRWQSVPMGDADPAGWVAERARPLFFDGARALRRQFPHTWSPDSGPIGYEASAHLPLMVGWRVVGALNLLYDRERSWSSQERTALAALARYTAQALDRALLLADRVSASQTLQRAMLTDLPEPDHLHVAARYLASSSSDQVGGDWYDAFLTPDGATALAIGDVTGHDLAAAADMGQLRSVLRGYGVDRDEPPSATLGRLDRGMATLRIDTLATVVLACIEQTGANQATGMRRLRWSNAGHPAPVLIHPGGRAEVLHTDPDVLVGLRTDARRRDHTVDLPRARRCSSTPTG